MATSYEIQINLRYGDMMPSRLQIQKYKPLPRIIAKNEFPIRKALIVSNNPPPPREPQKENFVPCSLEGKRVPQRVSDM